MSSNIKITKICNYCGGEYTARTTKTNYCSHRCSSLGYKAMKRKSKVEQVEKQVKAIKEKPITDIKTKEYLSISEICTLVGVSRWTVWRCIQNNELRAVKLGRRVIVRRIDIEKLFEPKYDAPIPIEKPITEWYTVQELMTKFSLTRDMVYNHIRVNKIPKKQDGRYVLISKHHFDKLFTPLNK